MLSSIAIYNYKEHLDVKYLHNSSGDIHFLFDLELAIKLQKLFFIQVFVFRD